MVIAYVKNSSEDLRYITAKIFQTYYNTVARIGVLQNPLQSHCSTWCKRIQVTLGKDARIEHAQQSGDRNIYGLTKQYLCSGRLLLLPLTKPGTRVRI